MQVTGKDGTEYNFYALPKGFIGEGQSSDQFDIMVFDSEESALNYRARGGLGNDHLIEVDSYWIWNLDNI